MSKNAALALFKVLTRLDTMQSQLTAINNSREIQKYKLFQYFPVGFLLFFNEFHLSLSQRFPNDLMLPHFEGFGTCSYTRYHEATLKICVKNSCFLCRQISDLCTSVRINKQHKSFGYNCCCHSYQYYQQQQHHHEQHRCCCCYCFSCY